MQKVRCHFMNIILTQKFPTAYRATNSFYFTAFSQGTYFKLSFTVLFSIAKFIILSLRGWFPYIPTS